MLNMNKIKLPISDKEAIRVEVKRRISLLSGDEWNKAVQSLCKKLLSSSVIQKAQNIVGYQALRDEVTLSLFFELMKAQGKSISIIDSQGNSSCLPSEGVILVPWRAFTLSGKRIGRGGGWYDRFLQEHPDFYTIGICFDCQIFPELPQDEWDVPMNEVIYSWPQTGQ